MSPAVPQRVIVDLSGPHVQPRVVRTAMTLARATDAVLYAIDVQGAGPRPSPAAHGAPPRIQDAHFALSKSGGVPDDVDVRIVVIDGDPGRELVRLADRPTDVLVVGRGPGGDDRPDPMSTVARECVEKAGCAVLVVPPAVVPGL